MGKKMKLPFTLKAREKTAASTPWPWPTCVNNPRTLSFRSNTSENIFKIMNTTYLEGHDRNTIEFVDTPDSFANATASFNSEISIVDQQKPANAVIQGLKSDRLFFKPGETSSILEEAKTDVFPRTKSVKILAMDSRDPFTDFRVSMEEMVEAHALKDWDCLEELLACYLSVNCKSNHGYIVEAFENLLIHLQHLAVPAKVSSNSAIDSTCSSLSPCLSSLENED